MKRELGGGERTYWIFNQWSPNNVLAIAELDGLLEAPQLEVALAALQKAHPLLGMRVLPDASGRDPRFVPRREATIPMETVDVGATGLGVRLDGLITDELNRWLDPRERLIRVVYVHDDQHSALIVSCLHIIADATSAMIALRDLLIAYAASSSARAAVLPKRPRRPAYEALLPAAFRGLPGVPNALRVQWAVMTEALRQKPQRLPKQAEVAMPQRKNGYLRHALPAAQVERLRRECAAHSVTVHGLLTAALGIAVAKELGLRDRPSVRFNIGSPLSIRSALRPEITDDLGSYVCTLNVFMDVGSQHSLWSIARQVNEDLQRRRDRGEAFAMLNAVAWIAPRSRKSSKRVVDMADNQGPGNVCLSNIGNFDMPSEAGGISVRSSHWCASLSITGYLLCAVCTTSRGLQLDFAYIRHIVTNDRARRIVDFMLREIALALPATTAPDQAVRALA